MIEIRKTKDDNILELIAPNKIFRHISEQLTAKSKKYYFSPAYKSNKWDGKIRFLNRDGTFQKGLIIEILKICKNNKLKVKYDKYIFNNDINFVKSELDFALKINLFEDTQAPHVEKMLKYKIGMAKLPTSAGKSYMQISMMNLYKLKGINNQIIIVPKATLVEQIYDDLITKSNFITPEECGRLYGGNKDWDKPIIVATWQSLKYLLQVIPDYGKRFELLIQDEVHISSEDAKVIKSVINSFNPKFKYGFSATIPEKKKDKLEHYNLVSLFGPIVARDTIENLQSKDRISNADIIVKRLKYDKDISGNEYKGYEDFIRYSPERREYLKSLINEIRDKDKNGNILMIVRNVDFAKEINEEIESEIIFGNIKIKDRTKVKDIIENNNGKILIASEGCFQMGENVPNLHYLILVQPRKSEKAQIQMVGRVLRKANNKTKAIIYDLSDDFFINSTNKDGKIIKKNFGKSHLKERLNIYKEYGLNVKSIENVKL